MKKREEIRDEERVSQDMSAVRDYDGEKSNSAKFVEALKEDEPTEEAPLDRSFKARVSDFWYHHKWKTLFALFVTVCVAVGVYQVATRENYDVWAMYSGPTSIYGEPKYGFEKVLSDVLTTDFDGDGKKSVYLYEVSSDSFSDMVAVGEAGVMFLDKELFERVRDYGGLVTLESALGYKPKGAIDDYGVELGKTDLYRHFEAIRYIPAETVVCLRGPSTIGTTKKSAQKVFEKNKAFFEDVMGFSAE